MADPNLTLMIVLGVVGGIFIIQGALGVAAYLRLTRDVHPDNVAYGEYVAQVVFLTLGVIVVIAALVMTGVTYVKAR